MKTKIQYVGLILLTLATLGSFSGCAGLPGDGPLKLKQTRDNADWAMVRFHNRVTYGFVTPQEQQSVTSAYKAYQTAFNEAVKQAKGNYDAPTPENVQQLSDKLSEALASLP